jgi:hypothetical protein
VSPRLPAALFLAAALLSACGPRLPGGGGAAASSSSPAPAADALEIEARHHLEEAERLLRAADATRADGDGRLSGRSVEVVREKYVEAGRLYEAASEERNRAYAAAAAAREAWAADAHAKCLVRRASAAEPSAPGR